MVAMYRAASQVRRTPRKRILALGLTAAALTVLSSCGSGSGSENASNIPNNLTVTTTQLPPAQISKPYIAKLAASGGVAPYEWQITNGTLPAGLTLDKNGALHGTPTISTSSALTVSVTDHSRSPKSAAAPMTLNVSPNQIAISISPQAASFTMGQSGSFTATTNDLSGVHWSISSDSGQLSPLDTPSGQISTLTAPTNAGTYTITATSITDSTVVASTQIGVTDLDGVFTYHNDPARDGVNSQEYALTAANVNTQTFGKLFSCNVDGAIHAQPLWAANLNIGGNKHNVVFVATEHDSVFAFDADSSPCIQLWSANLIGNTHGATIDETPVPAGKTGNLVGLGYGSMAPEVGITGTPVIDPAANILYVVSKSVTLNSGTPLFYQRLHALDLITGAELPGSPITLQATYPGSGDGSGTVSFNAQTQFQRAGLALNNGIVYVSEASHEDAWPYYGWLIGYQYSALTGFAQTAVLNTTPNAQYGGIWMSGAAPAIDTTGAMYLLTGNGTFDATSSAPPNTDFGDSLLKIVVNPGAPTPDKALAITQYFTPSDQDLGLSADIDFGAGGASILADLPTANSTQVMHLIIGGSKDSNLYILNRDNLGGYGDEHAWQVIPSGASIFSTAAFWNKTIYLSPSGGGIQAYIPDGTAKFTLKSNISPIDNNSSTAVFSTPSVSSNGLTNGLLWSLDLGQSYCRAATNNNCGPAVLHAYSADSLQEIWNSSLRTDGSDTAGYATNMTVPTVANGKVYVPTRGNNTGGPTTSTSVPGELDVYGLK